MSSLPLLNMQAPLVRVLDDKGKEIGKGRLLDPWNGFFQQFVQAAPAVANIVPTGSPFNFTANVKGTLIISGGTVSAISLIRGGIIIPLSTVRPLIVPISIGDTIRTTYTVTPTLQFLGA